jgi:hypothetical protein
MINKLAKFRELGGQANHTQVLVLEPADELPILRIAKAIQVKFRRIESTNEEIERLKT